MIRIFRPLSFIPCLLVLFALGCGGSADRATPLNNNPSAQGKLYVSVTGSSILRFDNAFALNGNVAPSARIEGLATQLNAPSFLFLDEQADRLFIADRGDNFVFGFVLVFEHASSKSGNVVPDRVIRGSATTLDIPIAVALDRQRDILYVLDANGAIAVFDSPASINGNVAPRHSFRFTASVSYLSTNLTVDSVNDRIFVARTDTGTGVSALEEFDHASTLTGFVTPDSTIRGANTHLEGPRDVLLDNLGRLIVDNNSPSNNSIVFYNNANASGDIPPSTAIEGSSTGLIRAQQMAVDTSGRNLYVLCDTDGKILVFPMSTALGKLDTPPVRTITSPALRVGVGLALDTTR